MTKYVPASIKETEKTTPITLNKMKNKTMIRFIYLKYAIHNILLWLQENNILWKIPSILYGFLNIIRKIWKLAELKHDMRIEGKSGKRRGGQKLRLRIKNEIPQDCNGTLYFKCRVR